MTIRSKMEFIGILLVLVINFIYVDSFPSGAGPSSCFTLIPDHQGTQPQSESTPVPVTTWISHNSYRAGETITVSLSGTYVGVLLQARRTDGSTTPFGTWVEPTDNNFKLMSCGSNTDSVTHNNSNPKPINAAFLWNAPDNEVANIHFIATFVQSFDTYWTAIETSIVTATTETVNSCTQNPCLNGGTCFQSDEGNGYICSCLPTYTGSNCENPGTVSNPCSSNPCLNGGTCLRGSVDNSYFCSCQSLYSGTRCETAINSCTQNPCLNGGTCFQSNEGIGYICSCLSTYTGSNCENPVVSGCNPNPCQSGGTCVTTTSGYTCTCPPNYIGTNCENYDHCANNQCSSGSTCVSLEDFIGYTCTCPPGLSGTLCTVPVTVSDPCSSSPCSNGGTCFRGSDSFSYVCSCQPEYTGTRCETVVSGPCVPNLCQNQAQCITSSTTTLGFVCNCQPNYTGTYCEVPTETPCSPNPCFNGGFCVESGGVAQCNCLPNYSGSRCEIYTAPDPCSSSPCGTNGNCLNYVTQFTCQCFNNYGGLFCENPPNPCLSNPCRNNAMCTSFGTAYACNCSTTLGYTGINCEIAPNPCQSSPCVRGICYNRITEYDCDCTSTSGYSGDRCEIQFNACNSNPCHNAGTCVDGLNSFSCDCRDGYQGNLCENNVNECFPNPCVNGGVCTDAINDFICDCQPGYDGKDCSTNTQECQSNPCQNGGICIDLVNGFFCQCQIGWGDTTCTQEIGCFGIEYTIQECSAVELHSSNYPNDYGNDQNCLWRIGTSNGNNMRIFIEDFDTEEKFDILQYGEGEGPTNGATADRMFSGEIEPQNWTTNTDDIWFTFQTDSGKTEKGFLIHIEDICKPIEDACVSNPCENNGLCTDFEGFTGYACQCPPQYTGTRCEQERETPCSSEPCMNGGQCVDIDFGTSYQCNCVNNFVGGNCENLQPTQSDERCPTDWCLNGGTCSYIAVDSYSCQCLSMFGGDLGRCENEICLPDACSDNAEGCVVYGSGSQCQCKEGFNGERCEFDPCPADKCKNGGTCLFNGDRNLYACHCVAGYTGPSCDTQITSCAQDPCQNEGTCEDTESGFTCKCTEAYQGDFCQQDKCDTCLNGGCVVIDENPVCDCTDTGFEGANCEIDIDECSSSPCINGGTCIDLVNTYECICAGTTGQNCDEDFDSCSSNPCESTESCSVISSGGYTCSDHCNPNPCKNSEECIPINNDYSCVCKDGKTGKDCSIDNGENEASSSSTIDDLILEPWWIALIGLLLILLVIFGCVLWCTMNRSPNLEDGKLIDY